MPDVADDRAVGGEDFSTGMLQRGTRLGRYELVLPIGVGGMARVWAARMQGQRGFSKLVAIKTILPHLANDPEFERMFLDEARIAAGVHHPNVCEIYELGEDRNVLYLAMEWVSGDSLAHVLRVGGQVQALDPRILARIAADACAGLHAAHNLADEMGNPLNVVHRDVSPHNVLISSDGNVKMADFGVAKALGQAHAATSAGQLKGKLAYMAPEQATGVPVDRRSDLFSLGAVMYEATTGKQPFRGEAEHQVLNELLKGQIVPPSRLVKGYPYELERIILRAMARDPLQRFPTMDRLRLALEEWLAKSGPVLTQSHVAAVMRERVGVEVERRKERIRTALAAMAESDLAGPHHVTPARAPDAQSASGVVPAGAAVITTSTPPPPRVSYPSAPSHGGQSGGQQLPVVIAERGPSGPQYVMAGALGVMAAAVLGVSLFWVWKSMQPPAPTAVVEHPAAIVSASPSAASAVASQAPSAAASAAPPIAFRVVPDQAFLVVDGLSLAPNVRSIPRPKAGESHKVAVRADGFEDQELTIDESAPTSVDVWLSAKRERKASDKSDTSKPSGDGPAGGAKAGQPEVLPVNPY